VKPESKSPVRQPEFRNIASFFQTIWTNRLRLVRLEAPITQVAAQASPPTTDRDSSQSPSPSPRHLCRNDPSLHHSGKNRPASDLHQARSTENPSRSYLAKDSAGTPGSTIIPSTSVMAAITYGEAAFNFSADTNT